jgi:protein-tyrosine phosphatase
MRASIYWIEAETEGRLGILARPRAGEWLDDEITAWRADGVDTVVSLLEKEEIEELGLERESALCHEKGIDFIAFPIPDRGVPASLEDASTLAQLLMAQVNIGKAVAVHCRAGIGRSSLIAACAMVSSGTHPDDAFEKIGEARGVNVPDTEVQRNWVGEFCSAIGQK